jgi:ABC-type multidrug transport system fused ATPase/permease subunit
MPQMVGLIDGSVLENILLGFPNSSENRALANAAVDNAGIRELINELELGIDTQIGERGGRISGGQKQKIGMARALLTNPQLIILDEATSALDSESEFEISQAIQNLRGKTTVILIAHRLSTVRSADQVLYVGNSGETISGTFETVRKNVPDFDRQATLMGL